MPKHSKVVTFAVEDCCLSIIVTGELVQDKMVEHDWPSRHLTFKDAIVSMSTAVTDEVKYES